MARREHKRASHSGCWQNGHVTVVEILQAVQLWYISYTLIKCLDETNKKSHSGCCVEYAQQEEGNHSGGYCNNPARRWWFGLG